MKPEPIPAQLNLSFEGKKYTFFYNELNQYQQPLYRKINHQMKTLQTYSKIKKQAPHLYFKAVGVLEYFIETMENYGRIKQIPRSIFE